MTDPFKNSIQFSTVSNERRVNINPVKFAEAFIAWAEATKALADQMVMTGGDDD